MTAATPWIRDRLPTEADADSLGMVRWGPDKPGMLMAWDQVRYSEPWTPPCPSRSRWGRQRPLGGRS
jgi:hypothetical protein